MKPTSDVVRLSLFVLALLSCDVLAQVPDWVFRDRFSNVAPTLAGLSLTPDGPLTTQDVTAAVTPSDLDEADTTVTVTFVWSVDDAVVQTDVVADVDVDTETTATLTASNFKKGELISVSVTASDGGGSSAASVDSTTVVNTAPIVSALSITPSPLTAASGPAVAVYTVTDPDVDDGVDTITPTIDWFVGASGSETKVATAATLAAADYARGDSVYFFIEVSDGEATDDGTSAAVTVANSAPSAPGITLTPADAAAGSADLVCDVTAASTDADGDTVAYSFVWRRDGTLVEGIATVDGDGDTSTIAAATVLPGAWSCTVTATDDFGTPASSAEVVANATASASCSDGFKNGDETGVDCGGSCGACDIGEGCRLDADCEFYCGSGNICVVPSADCRALDDDGLFGADGQYVIQPDVGFDPFEVRCEVDPIDPTVVWTRVANYRADYELFAFNFGENQQQTVDTGGTTLTDPFDLTDTIWGHVDLGLFAEGRDVRLRCKLDTADAWFSSTSSLFSTWAPGDKGAYAGTPWAVIGGPHYGRNGHFICGATVDTTADAAQYPGIGICSGAGVSGSFTNHTVSFSFARSTSSYGGGLSIGCNATGEDDGKVGGGRGEVWMH